MHDAIKKFIDGKDLNTLTWNTAYHAMGLACTPVDFEAAWQEVMAGPQEKVKKVKTLPPKRVITAAPEKKAD